MSATQLKIPSLGWKAAFLPPCSECLEIIARESLRAAYSGQQHDCYNCQNRLTVARIEPEGENWTDKLSAFVPEDEPTNRSWEVLEVSFDTREYTPKAMQDWLTRYGLAGFESKSSRMEWAVLGRAVQDAEAHTLTVLDNGVVGLCRLV